MLTVHLTDTIYPLYKVELNYAYPYDVIELLPFLVIGYVSLVGGEVKPRSTLGLLRDMF